MIALLLLAALVNEPTTHTYSATSPRNVLDLHLPECDGPHPVLLFVHGGAWVIGDKQAVGQKVAFTGDGYAVASCNYRLLADPRRAKGTARSSEVATGVADQAVDVAAAIDWLADHADEFDLDAGRIVLSGHSAGAHLSALVATDPQYLAVHNRSPSGLAGVVLIDGAGYDVLQRLADASDKQRRLFEYVFTKDPNTQRQLSPVTHAAAHAAPPVLILHVADRTESRRQSASLAEAMRAGGGEARIVPCEGKTHSSINRELGQPGDPATEEVRRFLLTAALGGLTD